MDHQLERIDQTTSAEHPTADRLADFVRGRLDEVASADVELHLVHCGECLESLSALEQFEDPFIADLVSAVGPDSLIDSDAALSTGKPLVADTPSSGLLRREVPQLVGRFQVQDRIGQGGFGIMLRAYDPNLCRDVALKIPRFEIFINDELRERFLREAQAVAALEHPGIIPVYESGEAGGICYIASALCRGPDLASWLRDLQQPMPVRAAASIIASVAEAVHHAHVRGVLHRDLKPSNVLLDPVDDSERDDHPETQSTPDDFPYIPKISDFGLAKLHGDSNATMSNVVMGTAAYMSPEQARGQMKFVGTAADIYSLGAIFYELLTLRPPIVGETELETLQRVQVEDPIPPTRLRPRIPRDLETIALKCLEKEPHRRYSTAKELSDDLGRFLDGQSVKARPVGLVGRSIRWCGRNPLVASLTACLLIALLLITVGSSAMSLRLASEVHRRTDAELESKQHLWESYFLTARGSRNSRAAGRRYSSLDFISKAVALGQELGFDDRADVRLRNEAIACLSLSDFFPQQELRSLHVGDAKHLAIDAQLRRAVWTLDGAPVLYVGRLDRPDETIGELSVDWGAARDVDIDPEGRFVAALVRQGREQRILLWDLAGSNPSRPQTLDVQLPACLAFEADRGRLVIGNDNGQISLYEPASGKQSPKASLGFKPEGCDATSRSGQFVFWAGPNVAILGTDGKIQRLRDLDVGKVNAASVTTDGAWIVAGCSDHNAYAWHLASGQRVHRLNGHQGWVTHVAFSQNDDLVLTNSSDGTTRLWEYWTGRELVSGDNYAIRFSRDGERLATLADSSLSIFQVTSGQRRTARGLDPSYETYAYTATPDPRVFVSSGIDGTRFWKYDTLEEIGWVDSGFTYWIQWRRVGTQLEMITGAETGIAVTPVRFEADGRVVCGITRWMDLPEELLCSIRPSMTADFDTLAYVSERRAAVIDLDREPWSAELLDNDVDLAVISPDGRWLATCAYGYSSLDIISVKDGQRVASVPESLSISAIAFSPDGQSLVVDAGGYLIALETGSWKETQRLALDSGVEGKESHFSFSADGRLLALSRADFRIKLIPGSLDRVLATLPSEYPSAPVGLHPHGSYLVCTGPDLRMQVWDLTAMQSHLQRLALDW